MMGFMSSTSRRSALSAAGLAAGAVLAFGATGAASWMGSRALDRREEISLAERESASVSSAIAAALSSLPADQRTRALRLAEQTGLTAAPSPSPSSSVTTTPSPAPPALPPLSLLEQTVMSTTTPEARGRAIAWFCVSAAAGTGDLSAVTLGSAVAEKGAWTPSGPEAGQAVAACDEASYWAESLAARAQDEARETLLSASDRWADRAAALRTVLPQAPAAPLGYPATGIEDATKTLAQTPARVGRLLLATTAQWPVAVPKPLLESTLLTLRELTG